MFDGGRVGVFLLSLLLVAPLAGCAELFDEFSSWPESATEVGAPLKPSEGPPTKGPVSTPVPPEQAEQKPARPEVYKGTGRFVGQPRAHAQVMPEGDVTLNFADTNIREVVRVILGDILEQNYVIDPNVQGTVTIQTSRPLAKQALLPTLETLLQLNGAALVDEDAVYRIVPLADAPKEAVTVAVGTRRVPHVRGYGIQVVPLQHVSVTEMMKVLTPIVSENNILYTDTARNLLLVGGTRREIDTILDTVAVFDVDWLTGMSFGFFPLQEAAVKDVVDELQKILTQDENAPLATLLRFVPIERLNALMVISPNADYIDKAGVWIARLDRTGDVETPRLFVYYVQNQRAADLADTLSRIFSERGAATTGAAEDRLRPGLQPISLQSPASAEAPSRVTEPAGARLSQAPTGRTATSGTTSTAGPTVTERQSSASARQQQRRETGGTTSATLKISGGQEARVIADDANNALVILATPGDYRMVESTLKKLDLVPLQVMIEATIAEVGLNDDLKYGLQWFFDSGNNSFTLSDAAGGAVASAFPGFSYVFSTNSARVVLNALDSITDVNVISSPQLMVLDNQTALLQVGDQVPIATQSAVSVVDPEAPIVNSIEQRDTGVILTVTPRVNAGGLVVLDIQQEISDVVPTETSGIDSPTISRRRIETSVAVQSGETVALGGLIREKRNRGKSGIPILHELPLIGSLFGTSTDSKERTELLVVITPRVVRSTEEARMVTNDLRKRLRSVSPLDRKIR